MPKMYHKTAHITELKKEPFLMVTDQIVIEPETSFGYEFYSEVELFEAANCNAFCMILNHNKCSSNQKYMNERDPFI